SLLSRRWRDIRRLSVHSDGDLRPGGLTERFGSRHLQMSALLHPEVERYREKRKVGHDEPGQRDLPAPRESDCGTLESADAAKQEKSRMRSGRRSSAST